MLDGWAVVLFGSPRTTGERERQQVMHFVQNLVRNLKQLGEFAYTTQLFTDGLTFLGFDFLRGVVHWRLRYPFALSSELTV